MSSDLCRVTPGYVVSTHQLPDYNVAMAATEHTHTHIGGSLHRTKTHTDLRELTVGVIYTTAGTPFSSLVWYTVAMTIRFDVYTGYCFPSAN